MKKSPIVLAICALLCLSLTACGSGDGAATSATPAATSSAPVDTTPTGPTSRLYVRLADNEVTTWLDTVEAKDGDIVEFRVVYENWSDQDHCNVWLQMALPEGLEYVPGSAYLRNWYHAEEPSVLADDIVGPGVSIESYGGITPETPEGKPGSNAFVTFRTVAHNTGAEPINVLAFSYVTSYPEGQTGEPIASGLYLTINPNTDPQPSAVAGTVE